MLLKIWHAYFDQVSPTSQCFTQRLVRWGDREDSGVGAVEAEGGRLDTAAGADGVRRTDQAEGAHGEEVL